MSVPAAGAFGPVQRIAAGALDVGYVDVGPARGRAVLLLHGWPYDIHSFGPEPARQLPPSPVPGALDTQPVPAQRPTEPEADGSLRIRT